MKKLVAVVAAAFVGIPLAVAPAEAHHARPGDHVAGHRCRTYDDSVTNENTRAALIDTAGVAGAVCETDAWRISDGTVIVWHDVRWRRVADHESLRRVGIDPDDRIVEATWEQVRQIQTKGGEPVLRMEQMIDLSAQYDIPLMVDIRNRLRSEAELVEYADRQGADVWWYGLINASCLTRNVDPFLAADAPRVGVKILRSCPLTPSQLEARGFTFTSEVSFRLTDAYLADANSRGIDIGVLDGAETMTEERAEDLVARGVTRLLLDRPRQALTWFDGPG
jgi:hypothetical protein